MDELKKGLGVLVMVFGLVGCEGMTMHEGQAMSEAMSRASKVSNQLYQQSTQNYQSYKQNSNQGSTCQSMVGSSWKCIN